MSKDEPQNEGEAKEEMVEKVQKQICLRPQEADDDVVVPQLLHELKMEILARVPCTEYWKLLFVNKRFSQSLKSSEIFKIRRDLGHVKPYVFMLSGSDTHWKMFDKDFENVLKLPKTSSDRCFFYDYKEAVCVGTHLLVIGREMKDIVVWRFELEMHKWSKGPGMITPRVKFGFASNGTNAFFAGGITVNSKGITEVVNIAERYNGDTKTWSAINNMHKNRKFSSGCFLHGKFYVLGGRDEDDEYLACGECYDEETDSWKIIPDMFKDFMSTSSCQWPPPIAVVRDNLYSLESSSNELCLYDINENSWKKLGALPVIANSSIGWRAVLKSVEERLLVVGASSSVQSRNRPVKLYTCCPAPNMREVIWEESKHCCNGVQLSYAIHNFGVMFA